MASSRASDAANSRADGGSASSSGAADAGEDAAARWGRIANERGRDLALANAEVDRLTAAMAGVCDVRWCCNCLITPPKRSCVPRGHEVIEARIVPVVFGRCDPDCSRSGVDLVDIANPAKVWRCDGCGAKGTSAELDDPARHIGHVPGVSPEAKDAP